MNGVENYISKTKEQALNDFKKDAEQYVLTMHSVSTLADDVIRILDGAITSDRQRVALKRLVSISYQSVRKEAAHYNYDIFSLYPEFASLSNDENDEGVR